MTVIGTQELGNMMSIIKALRNNLTFSGKKKRLEIT